MAELTSHLSEDQLQAYLDGVLDPGLEEQIQSHLAECTSCRGRLEDLENLSYRLESLPALELSRDLSSLVVSRLQEERSLTPTLTWTMIIESLSIAAVLAALVPVFQRSGWLPRLLNIGQELGTGLRVYLAQLASSWLVWWIELELQVRVLGQNLLPHGSLAGLAFSPWILIGAAGGLGVLFNYLLLRQHLLPDSNHQTH
ncbi:MAG: zf-HC2 domain-containing protein [Anaerolineales bacterium]